ncbi:Soluble hydrogenase 42 kDa subunit [Aquimixticola soesokkakensis]|uniref:Soluble hydrogenase 42 kDa subunit n=1 Tax=Aquimixticola soesokkakensis TaxID=1519096 RepID=A0A1Y5SH28_9RHOB|nr:aminotransferase class V-fold PLP-dependent enzyme [Aquimixticola soesokkakensis]SLN37727.1 Soluble hydrogenase 42 kDa subunit [Aquimixticola soesokkakensis]
MSLANGRTYLAIPGPSVMPERVLRAMMRSAPNIYTGEMVDMTHGLVPDLKTIAGTSQNLAMYITNGHGLWEASLSNVISRGDRVLSLVTGNFGSGWAGVARALGAQVAELDFGNRAALEVAQVINALKLDSHHTIKAVTCVHVDTATSVRNDIKALGAAMRDLGHPALLMVDCIASLGCDEFRFDDWNVDVMIAASQKGLMTPPGMGFIWFSDRALEAGKAADLRTPYWDWTGRATPAQLYEYFDGTAPTHHLYALRAAVDMILEEGLEAVWARHATLASAYHAAFAAWGCTELNIADPAARSNAVTTLRMTAPDATRLREWMEQEAGVTLGISLGLVDPASPEWHGFFRVGHMGHLNAHMVLGNIASLEAAFEALGIARGAGALEAATKVIAAGA